MMTDLTINKPAETKGFPTVITLRPRSSSSLKEITLIRGSDQSQDITLVATNKYQRFAKPGVEQLSVPVEHADPTFLLNSKKIPRPPNAFMIFANEWRKQLAQQHPSNSNKSISIRLGQLWKNMSKASKEIYYQRSRQAGQDHKLKYPGYVYNPKEARLRKALREQTKGSRNVGGMPARWSKQSLTINNYCPPLVSPILLSHHPNSKTALHEEVGRDRSYSNYLELAYNIPSNDYPVDNQPWYPYIQSNELNMYRANDNKLPVDWSTPYNSEQGNFIRASPQSSPQSTQNNQEVSNLVLNEDRCNPDQTPPCENMPICLSVDQKPVIEQVICQTNTTSIKKEPEKQVKELSSAKVISEGNLVMNCKKEDSSNTKLSGIDQACGSTEIDRFSQPDCFFESVATAAENERKQFCEPSDLPSLSFSPGSSAWTSSPFPYHDYSKSEPDLFGFQGQEETCNYMISPPQLNIPDHLYSVEENFYDPNQQIFVGHSVLKSEDLIGSNKFKPQDLSAVANINKPPVIISQNDNCCVVLESSVMDNGVKEYFSL